MKRIYKNWLVRITLGFAALTSLRLVSTLFHMTTLERFYKPRDFRRTSHLEISPEILDNLPQYCQTVYGVKMDPINLMFVGTEAKIRLAFEKAGWHTAHPSTPVHWVLTVLATVFQRKYRKGPFMPLFVDIGLQDLAFQKSNTGNHMNKRHHIRIWRTKHELPEGNHLWVAAATHETGLKIVWMPPFVVHKMNPDLDYERDFITSEVLEVGGLLAGEYQLHKPINSDKPKVNPNNDTYFTDGKAKIIEVV